MANSINDLRARVLAGENVPEEELLAAIAEIRRERFTAQTKSLEKKEAKAKAASMTLDDIFAPLDAAKEEGKK